MNISNVNVYVGTLCNNVEKNVCDSFLSYWYNLKKCINEDKKGKLRTYFTFKEHFIREKYTFLNDFKVRQIRISAHPLMIEIGRYNNLETEERLCKLCITQKIEDEYHFLIDDCPIYNIIVERFVIRKFQNYVLISIICQINQNSIIHLPMKIFQ